MKWITRENAKVDRIACPWLIRRFVDSEAVFLFVPPNDVAAVAAAEKATPYDVPGAELGHVAGRCSFESIVLKYGLGDDPGLSGLAAIVHSADVSEDVDKAPEARGLRAIAEGFALVHGRNDRAKMEHEFPLYDALYAWCRHRAGAPVAGAPVG